MSTQPTAATPAEQEAARLAALGEQGLRRQAEQREDDDRKAAEAVRRQTEAVARLHAAGEAGLRAQARARDEDGRKDEAQAQKRQEEAQRLVALGEQGLRQKEKDRRQDNDQDAARKLEAFKASPQGQGHFALAGARQQAGQAQRQAAYQGTPQGQQQLAGTAAARSGYDLAALRSGLQQAQAQTAHMRTPEGRDQVMEQARLRLAQQANQRTQEEMRARAESVAEFGRLGHALKAARSIFGELSGPVGVLQRAFGFMLGLAGHASPNAAATYEQSWNLLKARAGRPFVPVVENISQSLQAGADALGSRGPEKEKSMFRKALEYSPPVFFGEWLLTGERPDKRKERQGIDRSMQGMPQARISGFEEYYDRLQTAALNTGGLDAKIQQEQLQHLQGVQFLLEKIANDTEGLKNLAPAYR